jgi:branched-chain amino acid transport system permease protein
MIILGAYLAYFAAKLLGLDPLLALPLCSLLLFAFCFALQVLFLNRVISVSPIMSLIFTFGLDMVLINLSILAFTADQRALTLPYAHQVLDLGGGVTVPIGRIAVFAAAAALTLVLHQFLTRSRTGLAITATSFDRDVASLMGIDTGKIYGLTFAIGAGLAGAAGALLAVVYPFSPVTGDGYTLKAFVVVILGGLGSVPGAIVGGLALAITENLASLLLDPGYRDAVGFALVLLVLVWRPHGIMGRRFFAEAPS